MEFNKNYRRYMRCKRCHRKLKTEEAQKRGYGYHCFQMFLAEAKEKNKTLLDIAEELDEEHK